PRSRARATLPSMPPCIRRTVPGCTSSRSTSKPGRRSSPRPCPSTNRGSRSGARGAGKTPTRAAETVTGTRLAVWGDPIAHSKSPDLHAAAYRVQGMDWEYGRRQVTADGFAGALRGLDDSWRGLSLTMPLKEEACRAAETRDAHAEAPGAGNTL